MKKVVGIKIFKERIVHDRFCEKIASQFYYYKKFLITQINNTKKRGLQKKFSRCLLAFQDLSPFLGVVSIRTGTDISGKV